MPCFPASLLSKQESLPWHAIYVKAMRQSFDFDFQSGAMPVPLLVDAACTGLLFWLFKGGFEVSSSTVYTGTDALMVLTLILN